MKEKRNCSAPYPIYPPMMGIPSPYMAGYNQGYTNNSISSNTLEQQANNLDERLNNLESRISRIENILNNKNSTQYSGSNYYMV